MEDKSKDYITFVCSRGLMRLKVIWNGELRFCSVLDRVFTSLTVSRVL